MSRHLQKMILFTQVESCGQKMVSKKNNLKWKKENEKEKRKRKLEISFAGSSFTVLVSCARLK